ncbi:MAG TPA: ABC transporter ATP-binding protein [Leptolyngbyaceae cyanobacterium]
MQSAILVENLGKHFNRYHTEKPLTLMEAAMAGFRRIKAVDEFWALRSVSFEVAAGEMLGVIGHNGAGKSTLLQLLGKVAHPTEGRIKTRGRIGALLDLGAGFHGDLTGRENVFVTAIVAGLQRREVARRFDRIVEFAELEKFIDNPVRTYSTGMMMRLAFSVAVHTDPQILLVDEFLSVGDLSFQAKCLNRIAEMKQQGCAIVLVSHDVNQVERLCDRALWLKHGTVAALGEPTVVAGQYTMEMRSQSQQRTPFRPPRLTQVGTKLRVNENRFGSLDIEIVDVRLLPNAEINSGSPLCVEIEYHAHCLPDSPIFSVEIIASEGQSYFNVNTQDSKALIQNIAERGVIKLQIDRLDLSRGNYFVNVGVYEKNWSYAYDYHWQIYPLLINHPIQCKGILCTPHRWEVVEKMSDRVAIK